VDGRPVIDLTDPLGSVVGQPSAVARLRAAVDTPVPAYLLVGPAGSGVRRAATLFAGELLGARDPDGRERHRRLAAAEEHPDLVVIEREGPFITADQARMAVRSSLTSPLEARVKVLLLPDMHLVRDAGPMLLKAIEEPPAATMFVLVADEISRDLITIASRCTVIEFGAVALDAIVEGLMTMGVDRERAQLIAHVSGGSLDRAELLATDEAVAERWERWRQLPAVLDGTGAAATAATDAVLGAITDAAAPLEARHAAELVALDERAERFGERGLGRNGVVERHKRELRRLRTDELLLGLSALGGTVRDGLASGSIDAGAGAAALQAVLDAGYALRRNPNERLLLQRLLLGIGRTLAR